MKDFVKDIMRFVHRPGFETRVHEAIEAVNRTLAATLRQLDALVPLVDLYGAKDIEARSAAKRLRDQLKALLEGSNGVPNQLLLQKIQSDKQKQERVGSIKRVALELASALKSPIRPYDVLEALIQQGITLSVKKPNSVIATVLSSMDEFTPDESGQYVPKSAAMKGVGPVLSKTAKRHKK